MAFNQIEYKIIQDGLKAGRTREDIELAVGRYRAGSTIESVARQNPNETITNETGRDIAEAFIGAKDTIKQRANNIVNQYVKSQEGERNPVAAGFDIAGETLAGISGLLGETVIGAGKVLLPQEKEDAIKASLTDAIQPIIQDPDIQDVVQRYQNLDENTKQDLRTGGNIVMSLVDILTLGTTGKGVRAAAPIVKESAGTLARGAAEGTVAVGKGIREGLENSGKILPFNKRVSVAETISPKINAKEGRKIISEGRVERPAESILFGRRPDVVTPDERTAAAAAIVETRIPNAENLDIFQLSNEIKKITDSSVKDLEPKFRAVPVSEDVVENTFNKWEQVKLKQADEPEFQAFGGAAKFQERFENFLAELAAADNLDDAWKIRIRYDDIIPDSVKQASSNSAPSTALQHDMWLENRALMNDLIFELSNNLDETGKQAFDELSLLYQSRNNLIQKGKIDTKGEKGLVNTRNTLKALLGGGAAKLLIE